MKLLFAGTPAVAVPSLLALVASSHEVVGVITQPAAASGRGRAVAPSAVAVAAEALSLPVFAFEDINDDSAIDTLSALTFDAVAVVAYGQLLKEKTLLAAPQGWINLHFSLLPAFRGAAPVQRALMVGESITGVSTFVLDAGMDSGPVIAQMTTNIGDDETAGALLDRLSHSGAEVLVSTFDALASGHARPRVQSQEGASYAPKLSVAEANIKWHHPALGIHRWIRGCTPDPGAWSTALGERIEIGPITLLPEVTDLLPGECRITKSQVAVGTGSIAVALGEVKPAGKKWMVAADWARGLRESDVRFEYVQRS